MRAVFTLLAMLFTAKLAWNVSIPLWLQRGRGVSLHTQIEIALLIAMTFIAVRPTLVAVVGALAIAASYGGAFLLAMVLGWRYRSPD